MLATTSSRFKEKYVSKDNFSNYPNQFLAEGIAYMMRFHGGAKRAKKNAFKRTVSVLPNCSRYYILQHKINASKKTKQKENIAKTFDDLTSKGYMTADVHDLIAYMSGKSIKMLEM